MLAATLGSIQGGNWIVVFAGAIIGGALSAFGAWLAIGRQFNLQNKNLVELAHSFFSFLIREQIRSIENMIEYRSAHAGQTAFFDLEKMQSNYVMFDRNREHIVRFQNHKLRTRIIDMMSGLETWAINLKQQEQVIIQESANPSQEATEAKKAAFKNISELFSQLPNYKHDLNSVLDEING